VRSVYTYTYGSIWECWCWMGWRYEREEDPHPDVHTTDTDRYMAVAT